MVTVTEVAPHSRAARAGIVGGDVLTHINGHEICDVLDYRFYLAEREVTLSVLRQGEALSFHIRKGEYDDVGLEFKTPLMDEKQRCKNACVFCFIDQLPKGMRESLYFKDDDSRLSFLHGNYITLTNLTDKDVDRILLMRFSPINVSIHTTNPTLRVKMMKNKRAGEVLSYLDRLAAGGTTLRGQIVLCRGLNDGAELDRTLRDLSRYYPALDSVSVVPAGLTDHREGLYPLTSFSPEEARAVVKQVESFARAHKEKTGSRLFFLADEFYLKAGLPLPREAEYEGYPQIENGVGMITSMETEFLEELAYRAEAGETHPVSRTVSLATGFAAYGAMCELARRAEEAYRGLRVLVYPIENRYFGKEITVSGLLTGRDMAEQLQGRELGDELLFPPNALRAEGDLFLCGMTPEELSEKIGAPARPGGGDGAALLDALLGEESV